MNLIGASLIKKSDNSEVLAFPAPPSAFSIPGEQSDVHGAPVGWENDAYKLVERWQTGAPTSPWCSQTGQSVAFDGVKTVVTLQFSSTQDIVPQSVTMVQARLALNASGQLVAINALVAAADQPSQLMWEYSAALQRSNPTLLALSVKAGMSSADVDNLFRAASEF